MVVGGLLPVLFFFFFSKKAASRSDLERTRVKLMQFLSRLPPSSICHRCFSYSPTP